MMNMLNKSIVKKNKTDRSHIVIGCTHDLIFKNVLFSEQNNRQRFIIKTDLMIGTISY